MPRQLPWAKKNSTSSARATPATKPLKKSRALLDDDDEDFFQGTVLASKGKGKARTNSSQDSFDDLPDISTSPGSPRKRRKHASPARVLSSSPPPMDDLPPPDVEFMKKGLSRFDLRDDEWMMVEDEFLQTAKLFTMHLHLAEYERLKETIQQKKDSIRPVAANAKPSAEASLKAKADAQLMTQREALRDILDGSGSEELDDILQPPTKTSVIRPVTTRPDRVDPKLSTSANSSKRAATPETTDSEDLDAPRRSVKPAQSSRDTFVRPSLPPKRDTAPIPPVRRPPFMSSKADRPAAQAPIPTPARQRKSPLDYLDDEERTTHSSSPSSRPTHPSSPTKSAHTPARSHSIRPHQSQRSTSTRPSFDLLSDLDYQPRHTVPKEAPKSDHHLLAKRRQEQEREKERKKQVEDKQKKKAIKLDDIPTFLI
ncbi:hypothetical protein BU24DRAFT_418405 [Aaosphaeria arxii CBS 175.79]|uniref:Uncharacterized protein n=1 Tax=Aaosphaeria arxii CBS 175.79 TaxID=1450172 RepID=A0A6A5Y1Z9_9PLEO|nr:uncharacterized protein BU24DRAFT_418405 [Aaosphaeria arxii CBS 175.79]KAF2018850.1 hypothetical protein BU24DRAFT_418405 [Aaosphaeria arxii CBS 175.79]